MGQINCQSNDNASVVLGRNVQSSVTMILQSTATLNLHLVGFYCVTGKAEALPSSSWISAVLLVVSKIWVLTNQS